MLPYFTIAGITAVLAWINSASLAAINKANHYVRKNSRITKWFIADFLIVLILMSFSALRFEVGTDFTTYVHAYEVLSTENWAEQISNSPQEFGYVILALITKTISDGPELLFWATSGITIIPAYIAMKKSSRDPAMSIILYVLLAFYVTPFNVIRQGMAISLNFWASTFLGKNKTMFLLINFIASTIHITALYAAVIQIVLHKKKLRYGSFSTLVFLTIIAYVSPQIWTWIIDIFDRTSERYDGYLDGNPSGIGTYLLIGARLSLILYVLFIGRSNVDNPNALYCMIGVAFLVLGTQSIVISRMSDYFFIFLILLIPNQIFERRDRHIHMSIIYVACLLYFWLHISNWGDLTPYQFSP